MTDTQATHSAQIPATYRCTYCQAISTEAELTTYPGTYGPEPACPRCDGHVEHYAPPVDVMEPPIAAQPGTAIDRDAIKRNINNAERLVSSYGPIIGRAGLSTDQIGEAIRQAAEDQERFSKIAPTAAAFVYHRQISILTTMVPAELDLGPPPPPQHRMSIKSRLDLYMQLADIPPPPYPLLFAIDCANPRAPLIYLCDTPDRYTFSAREPYRARRSNESVIRSGILAVFGDRGDRSAHMTAREIRLNGAIIDAEAIYITYQLSEYNDHERGIYIPQP